jgi:CheY-like chemotaxis protein
MLRQRKRTMGRSGAGMTNETIRLLFVEDEPDLREIVEAALRLDAAFAVTSFVSAEDALAAVQGGGSGFDLALLDFRLPAMSGLELHRMLRCVPGLERIKTVLITASILPRNFDESGSGIVGVIAKPFHPLKLAGELRGMLARAG